MSVISVNEHYEGETGQDTRVGAALTRVFRIQVSDAADSPVTVLAAPGLPVYGDVHPDDSALYVSGRTPRRVKGTRLLWDVFVSYSSEADHGAKALPTAERPDIVWSHYTKNEVASRDKDGAAIQNKAGDYFDPPVERECHYQKVTITRYEDAFDPDTAEQMIDSVNSAEITIAGKTIAALRAIMVRFDGQPVYVNGDQYYRVTYEIMIAKAGENQLLVLANRGFNAIGSVKYRIRNADGEEYTEPQWLDSTGQWSMGHSSEYSNYIHFHYRAEEDWSALGLPATMWG